MTEPNRTEPNRATAPNLRTADPIDPWGGLSPDEIYAEIVGGDFEDNSADLDLDGLADLDLGGRSIF